MGSGFPALLGKPWLATQGYLEGAASMSKAQHVHHSFGILQQSSPVNIWDPFRAGSSTQEGMSVLAKP